MQIILIIPPFFDLNPTTRLCDCRPYVLLDCNVPRNRERSGKSLLHRASRLLLQCSSKSLISVLFFFTFFLCVYCGGFFFVALLYFVCKARAFAITSHYHTAVVHRFRQPKMQVLMQSHIKCRIHQAPKQINRSFFRFDFSFR